MSRTPLQIIEGLIDEFYEVEDEFAQALGVAYVDPRIHLKNLHPYTAAGQVEEELDVKFQRIYSDLSNLMYEIKELEER